MVILWDTLAYVFLLILISFIVNTYLKENEDKKLALRPDLKRYSLKELSKYNGQNCKEKLILISVCNLVFDVSQQDYYQKNGSYNLLAGRECSIALAKMSFDPIDLNTSYDDGLDSLKNEEKEALIQWLEKMKRKYKLVGVIEDKKIQ